MFKHSADSFLVSSSEGLSIWCLLPRPVLAPSRASGGVGEGNREEGVNSSRGAARCPALCQLLHICSPAELLQTPGVGANNNRGKKNGSSES